MSRASWVVILAAVGIVSAIAAFHTPGFLISARGSYSGLVTVSAKTDATELPMMGYLLTMRHKTEFAMLSPGSKEQNWQPPLAVGESREERVRGGFSSGWTWTGYRYTRYPYADVVLVAYRDVEGQSHFRIVPIPWDATNTRATVELSVATADE